MILFPLFASGINNPAVLVAKFATSVVDTGGKFAINIVGTGSAPSLANISANFRKDLK
jgi:hypothetical protein